jgi:hypothetical protein
MPPNTYVPSQRSMRPSIRSCRIRHKHSVPLLTHHAPLQPFHPVTIGSAGGAEYGRSYALEELPFLHFWKLLIGMCRMFHQKVTSSPSSRGLRNISQLPYHPKSGNVCTVLRYTLPFSCASLDLSSARDLNDDRSLTPSSTPDTAVRRNRVVRL